MGSGTLSAVLRLAGARLLDDRDAAAVYATLAADPVGSCMVAAKVEAAGLSPRRLGGELWTVDGLARRSERLRGLCFSGPNLVPLVGDTGELRQFADRALRHGRTCSSLVGPSEKVLTLWEELSSEWGQAREVRADQPLLALGQLPAVAADSDVRQVRMADLDRYYPAAVAMFIEEVGVDPRDGDGGANYRARVAELISSGRAFARFEHGEVVFKAEVGALSGEVGQIQGVWVHPDRRGSGLGSAGTASVARWLMVELERTPSLYVNAYNQAALSVYRRIGFRQVGQYATVLF